MRLSVPCTVAQLKLRDRADAGQQLAAKLSAYADRQDVLVLGLPRGGVPVAYEIAKALHTPLDVFLVRKLGVPGFEELAMGAIASGGGRVLNDDIVSALAISDEAIDAVAAREQQEIERREHAYRRERAAPNIQGKTIILADDGVATGATLRAALAALRAQNPAKIIVAVGVAPRETYDTLEQEADEVVCVLNPDPFWAVGLWFSEFFSTTDEEVCALLAHAYAHLRQVGKPSAPKIVVAPSVETISAHINAGDVMLAGDLSIPHNVRGLVLFAHGSGSSRFSPRNRFVAHVLQQGELATLLLDLLTPGEEELDTRTRQFRFDIDLLANRLTAATNWILHQPKVQHLKIGYFGSSTGAAAALIAAAQRPQLVAAVVSSGGRPDLAMPVLSQVWAPTLLIVGGNDPAVIRMNKEALSKLQSQAKLEIVPGASHLFEEPGTLDVVARLACDWFRRHVITS